MKLAAVFAFLCFTSLMSPVFAEESSYTRYEGVEEYEEITHDMMIGCVSSKRDCTTMAQQQGYNTSRTVKDTTRCPRSPKTLACIVKH
jgi:hypothetical protein